MIDYPYMKTLPDYSVIRFKNRNILTVGGAISVGRTSRLDTMQQAERKKRIVPKCYWEDEIPVFNEPALKELKSNGIMISTVVTHTAPSFCEATDVMFMLYLGMAGNYLFRKIGIPVPLRWSSVYFTLFF